MPFDPNDPRTRLAGQRDGGTAYREFGGGEFVKFYETEPQIRRPGETTWLARGQNFVVAYSQVSAGTVLDREDQADEYVVLLPDAGTHAAVESDAGSARIAGESVTFVPAGASHVEASDDCRIVRIFTTAARDLAALAANAAGYATPKPNVAPLEAWPEPPAGERIRSYSLDVPRQDGRFGRIWRGRSIMVNYSDPRLGPRDVAKMSPHVHDAFEQGSLVLAGTFVHHLRWPWLPDMRRWREDQHEICAGPSLAVIPPGVIHTSQQVSQGVNQLVDIFCPPRLDFSQVAGWVLNADEYPMPAANEPAAHEPAANEPAAV